MDEIDYFPKRDKFKVKKDVGSDWNKLKKQKIITKATTLAGSKNLKTR